MFKKADSLEPIMYVPTVFPHRDSVITLVITVLTRHYPLSKMKVPLTTFTLVEDVVMVVMGLMILFL